MQKSQMGENAISIARGTVVLNPKVKIRRFRGTGKLPERPMA